MNNMKKIILFALVLSSVNLVQAQSEKFKSAMKMNISSIDSSYTSPQNLLSLSNSFERIGNAEKNQWLPYYYAALMQLNYGFMQKDMSGGDQYADKASSLLQKADSLMPNNSEISCLKSMIATVRMLVQPQARYMQYGPDIETNLEAAKKQDPSNPRPYYLKGENLKNTPEQFGGGCAAASESLKIAKEKFSSFKPASDLSPNWGAQRINMLISECK